MEDPKVWNDLKYAQSLGKEKKSLENVVFKISEFEKLLLDSKELYELAKDESKFIFLKFSDSYEKARVASYKSKFITELLTIIFISISISFIFITGGNISNLILSLSLFIRMTPKVYNAQTRLLDSVAMVSWPRLHKEKIEWAKNYKNKSFLKYFGQLY